MVDINKRLDQFLFDYRVATHTTTKESTAKLLLGRDLRTRFDLLKPNIRTNVHKNQEKQINSRSNSKEFKIDEIVLVREYVINKWIKEKSEEVDIDIIVDETKLTETSEVTDQIEVRNSKRIKKPTIKLNL